MRRPLLMLALVLAGALLTACGKGSATSSDRVATVTVQSSATSTSAKPPTSVPAPAPSDASKRQARAFAQAVNLTPADVPGFSATDKKDSSSSSEKRLEHEMLSCAGIAGSAKAVLEESSKDFRLKRQILDLSVSSEVAVQTSAAQAQKGLAAIRSAHVRGCFTRFLQQLFDGEQTKGAKAGPVTIQAGTPPAPGMTGSFGWRVTATFLVRGVKVPIYLDFLGFVDGPSQITLLSTGLLRPFPASVQQHLFAELLARARSHKP
jgi:hypothetical protein